MSHGYASHPDRRKRLSMSPATAMFGFLLLCGDVAAAQEAPPSQQSNSDTSTSQTVLETVVREAFRATHDGWSSDEVLIRDDLNQAFIAECRNSLPEVSERECNWTLLNLRKAGKLNVASTRSEAGSCEDLSAVAEIAARSIQDREKISTDAIMADPEHRAEFDRLVLGIDSEADAYLARKCALRLRKTRQLRPELITRIADWDRQISDCSVSDLIADPDRVPAQPGVYLFRDRSGYLYIGEAIDLRQRLRIHVQDSDRQNLAEYLQAQSTESVSVELHVFPSDSRMREIAVRRAYESELIRSREPRFNVRP